MHSSKSDSWGKEIYYLFLAQDPDEIDPRLTEDGAADAKGVGSFMRHDHLPPPQTYYSSPLRRCITTATYIYGALHGPMLSPKNRVKEDLRVWMGCEHNHSPDQRRTKKQIEEDTTFRGKVDLTFKSDERFGDKDIMSGNNTKETYEDVRVRITRALINIFKHDDARVIHLFLHGRCFRYFLRTIGPSRGR